MRAEDAFAQVLETIERLQKKIESGSTTDEDQHVSAAHLNELMTKLAEGDLGQGVEPLAFSELERHEDARHGLRPAKPWCARTRMPH